MNAREHLAGRDKWQDFAGVRGQTAEDAFQEIMSFAFQGTVYSLVSQPKDLAKIYGTRGIRPDFAIANKLTDRTMWVEIKRQQAAGNAHERACKYFTPGIVSAAQRIGNLGEGFPFWLLFTNGIASDERYRTEIQFWFTGLEGGLTLWKSFTDHETITDHFDAHIVPLLSQD